jgi:hypothetical protein
LINGLVASLVIISTAVMTGCFKTAAPAVNSTVSPAASTAAGPSGTPTPTSVSSRQGVSGTLTAIKGNTLTVSTVQSGQVSVTIGDNASIQRIVSGGLSDLKQGDFLTVVGTPDAGGNVAASSIVVQPPGQGQGFSAPRSGNGSPGRGTVGNLASINGNTLTLTTLQGSQVVVTVSSATIIDKTLAGTSSDLQPGESLTIMGSPDTSGNIAASLIIIRPPAQEITSTPSPSSPAAATPPAVTPPAASPGSEPSSISTSIPSPSSPGPSALSGGTPLILIVAPINVSTIPAGDVTIYDLVSNFNLVDKTGEANVAGEGHIIYYLDVTPPTIPGQSALSSGGTYAESTATSYTWHNVAAGYHFFSAELVNNDNTPLSPLVTVTVYVTAQGALQSGPGPSSTSAPASAP